MNEVKIPYCNSKVFQVGTGGTGFNCISIKPEVGEWLTAYCPGGWGENPFGSWEEVTGLFVEEYCKIAGLGFQFIDENQAMLFMLTWVLPFRYRVDYEALRGCQTFKLPG